MSDRLPQDTAELWLEFTTPTDPESMFCGLGIGGFDDDLHGLPVDVDFPSVGALIAALGDIQTAIAAGISADYDTGPGYVLVGGDDEPSRYDATESFAGGLVGDAAPSNCALLLKKYTTRAGRRGRGRMYVPGIPEALVEPGGQVDSAHLAFWNTTILPTVLGFVTDLGSGFTDGEIAPVLLHDLLRDPETGDPIPGSGLPPDRMVALQPDGRIATQRRRLRR